MLGVKRMKTENIIKHLLFFIALVKLIFIKGELRVVSHVCIIKFIIPVFGILVQAESGCVNIWDAEFYDLNVKTCPGYIQTQ